MSTDGGGVITVFCKSDEDVFHLKSDISKNHRPHKMNSHPPIAIKRAFFLDILMSKNTCIVSIPIVFQKHKKMTLLVCKVI